MVDISELPSLGAGNFDDQDFMLIYDVSAGSNPTKKVRFLNAFEPLAYKDSDVDFETVEITDLTTLNATLGFTDGATITKVLANSVTVTPVDILAGASETVTATLTNAETADHLTTSFTSPLPDGLMCQSWISVDGTISFRFHNTTSLTVIGASYTARVLAVRAA